MTELLIELGSDFRQYQYQSALAIIATLLVMFGSDLNGIFKKLVARQHFIIRSAVFIFVCTIVYGFATVWLTNQLSQQLGKIPNLYIVPFMIITFMCLGMYAQKQRHI